MQTYTKQVSSNDKYWVALAKEAFKQGDYWQLAELKQQLKHPAELRPSEKEMFELSSKRK